MPALRTLRVYARLCVGLLAFRLACVALALWLSGCVTRMQVCGSYDRRLGRERPSEGSYARDSAGASVCADVERPQ